MSESHEVVIPVLGIPVRFASDDPVVLEVVEEAFGTWRDLDGVPTSTEDGPVSVRISVVDGDEGDGAPPTYRLFDGRRFLLHTPGSVGMADPGRREARAFVTRTLLADRQRFRYAVVEGLTLGTLTPLDRQPLHAGAVTDGGAALLLAGPSGTGKSTLVYAAARAGLHVLADDTVFLQSEPRLRVWGLPGWLHLPPDVGTRFPELAGSEPTLMANGKHKVVVDARTLDAVPERPVAEGAVACLIERGDPASLRRLPREELVERIVGRLEPGFDLFAGTIGRPLGRLAAEGGWVLRVPPDPMEAVPLLREMLQDDRAGAEDGSA